ncbi:MAG: cytochrome c [Salinimicrobium sp.]
MKSLFKKSIFFILAASAVSCMNNSKPNYQYMPDMYESVSYEPYGAYDIFVNEQEAKLPVEGTVARGWKPYAYENTFEGRAAAKAELTNPLPYTEDNLTKGEGLYTIYCAVCHGDKGDGKGILVQREKFLGVPRYDDAGRAITEGSVYHTMYYGLNAMGSYASQTSIEERWQIDHYVMSLKDQLMGKPAREFESGSDNLIPAVNAEKEMVTKEASTTGEAETQNQE